MAKRKKKNTSSKILTSFLSLVLIIGVVFGAIWSSNNIDKVKLLFNGTSIYTFDDVNNAYDDGYNEALDNKAEFEEALQDYRLEVANLNDQLTLKTTNLTIALQELEEAEETEEESTETISVLQAQIASLTSEVENLETQLQQKIDYYEGLLAEVDISGRYVAIFMYEDAIISVRTANEGDVLIDIPALENSTYKEFMGWSLDGENIIDLVTTPITEDITLLPIFLQKYDVVFKAKSYSNEQEIIEEVIISHGSFASTEINTVTFNNDFMYNIIGWSLDGENIIDLVTTPITEDITFIAILEGPINGVGDFASNHNNEEDLSTTEILYFNENGGLTTSILGVYANDKALEVEFTFDLDINGDIWFNEPIEVKLNENNNYNYSTIVEFYNWVTNTTYSTTLEFTAGPEMYQGEVWDANRWTLTATFDTEEIESFATNNLEWVYHFKNINFNVAN